MKNILLIYSLLYSGIIFAQESARVIDVTLAQNSVKVGECPIGFTSKTSCGIDSVLKTAYTYMTRNKSPTTCGHSIRV
jgi:hypothetical protein